MRRYLAVFALALLAFVLPPVAAATKTAFLLTQATMSAYYVLASLGLCALMGYAGQISLGQAGFFAIGGYASSFISTRDLGAFASAPAVKLLDAAGLLVRGTDAYGATLLSPSPWVACACAVLIAAGVAALIGTPVLRLKGHYLAMATLGFGIVIEKVVRGTKLLGGADGISGVPAFSLFPGLAVTGGRAARAENFTIAWVTLALGLLLLVNLFRSRSGRALRALHDGEEAAGAMGVDTASYKLKVFVLGAVYAAVAGILLTHYNGSIGPGEASVMKSTRYVAIVAVGGMANLTGTLVAGLVLNFLSLRGVFGSLDDGVFGVILVLVMLFGPGSSPLGLRSAARRLLSALPRRKAAPPEGEAR
jgi:branched-chain amino acid transport system permease protein